MLLLGVFAGQAIRQAATTSATNDEPPHLAAGYAYLRWHDYRLNVEHPPLVKKMAALPLLAMRVWPPEVELGPEDLAPTGSPSLRRTKALWTAALARTPYQWAFGNQFLYGIRDETLQRLSVAERWTVPTVTRLAPGDYWNDAAALLFRGRLPIVGLGVGLGLLIFLCARQLFGPPGAFLALGLYAFDPNMIANSAVVTTDVGVTLGIFGAMYFLWRCCRVLRVRDALLMAAFFGLAFAAKFSSVLLLPMATLAVLIRVLDRTPWPVRGRREALLATPLARLAGAAALLVIGVGSAYLTLWAAYDFRFSAARDPFQAARAESLLRVPPDPNLPREPGHFPIEGNIRRMAALAASPDGSRAAPDPRRAQEAALGVGGQLALLAARHHLVPEAYLQGLVVAHINSAARPSFLRGEVSNVGFRSYFLWTFLLKTPLVTLAAIVGAGVLAVARRGAVGTPPAWPFLTIPIFVYYAVALGWTLNIGHRHLLPIYPFLFVWCGSLGALWGRVPLQARPWAAALSLAVIITNANVVFAPPWRPALIPPHHLAYFNELAGGPRNGHRSLVDANLDWGQDLGRVKDWLDARGIVEPINLSYFGMADPLYHGIPHVNLPGGFLLEPRQPLARGPDGRVSIPGVRIPGHLVVSATNLAAPYMPPEERALWREFLAHARPVGTIGYSLFVFSLGGDPR